MNRYLQWLLDNQGKYEITPDNSYWKDSEGNLVFNKISVSYKGTCMSFTGEGGLIKAIDYFMGE